MVISIILLAQGKAAYAESVDPMDISNSLTGPSAQYNTMVTPAYTRNNTVEDYINPQTGELALTQTDYVLPGVNGLDLAIKRLYKSGSASHWKSSVKYVSGNSGALVDYLENTYSASDSYGSTFYEMRYNLGVGWRFSFPTIEKKEEGNYLYLHTESGDVYNLSGPTNDVYKVENHPVEDLTIKKCTSEEITKFASQGTVFSQTITMKPYYVMTEKNGKKTYFDEDGRILNIVDRYSNQITFKYQTYDCIQNAYGSVMKMLISTIIDSMGREVNITYKEDYYDTLNDMPYNLTADNLQHKYKVIISLPNQKTIIYNKSCMNYYTLSDNNIAVVRTRLEKVYDVDAEDYMIDDTTPCKYEYYYEQIELGFTFLKGTEYLYKNLYENLSSVYNWKTNLKKRFIYQREVGLEYKFVKPLTDNGSMEYRKVVSVEDCDIIENENLPINDVTYTYTKEPQGYKFVPATTTTPAKWVKDTTYNNKVTYRYSTEIKDGRGAKTTYTYDGNSKAVNVVKWGKDHKDIITTTCDDTYKLPQIVKTDSYNVVNWVEVEGNTPITKTENYKYDIKGNLIQYTGPEATRNSSGTPTGTTYTTDNVTVNEHTVVYTYDSNFSILKSKTWKQDTSNKSRIESTVDPTNGNVTKMRNIHSGNDIVTDFLYDAMGNMTQKKVHYYNDSGNTYTSNYIYGSEEDGIDRGGESAKYKGLYYGGAYLTREYSVIDGVQISKKYDYDFNTGLKKVDIDENNNKTDYVYDDFNRLTTIKYPDQSEKQYTYYDYDKGKYKDYYGLTKYNRVIQYKDQNNNQFQYAFDILDNLVQFNVYDDKNLKWIVLRQMNYDKNGNKTEEKDAYGHNTKFVYDSANRLTDKQFWSDDSTKTKSLKLQYTVNADINTPLLITITDEDGYVKKYHYDILNRLVKLEVTPDKTNFYSTIYTYDYVGHKTSEADALTHATSYTYDDLGRLKTQADARAHTTQYSYDAGGKLIQQINPREKSTSYDYDLLGRLIRKKEPATDGTTATTRYIYDAAGNKTKEITPNNYNQSLDDTPAHAATMTGMSYTYTTRNQLQSVISPEGSIIEYRNYDQNGNVQKVVDGLRYTGDINTSLGTTYVYDAFNRKTKQTDALGNYQSFSYLLTGQLNTWTDANQNSTTYLYYPDGTLQNVIYPDIGSTVNYDTNPDGTLKKVIQPSTGFITYTYDNRKFKKSETDQRGNTTNYSYNGFGKVGTITDVNQNTIVYRYYNNGNLASVKDKRGHNTNYFYYIDNDLRQKKTDIDASHYATEDYVTDECGNVVQKTLSGTDTTSSRVTTYNYYYNNLLQTTADTSPQDNSGSQTTNYYDKDHNLIKVESKRDDSNTDVLKYTYDNRDRKVQSIKLVNPSDVYNSALLPNRSALTDPDDSTKLQLITGYTYDILGNLMATIDPRAYGYLATDTANRSLYTITNGYDSLNRLQTVSKMINGANVATKYYYDAVGNKKAVHNDRGFYTVYTYDNMNRPLTLTDPETDTSLKTITETQIITLAGQITNTLNKTLIYGYDLAGNKTSVIDANGYRTNYVYDTLNRLQTVKAPYDPSKPDSSTNPYNQVIGGKVYDENGNLIKEIDAKGYLSGSDDSSRYGTEYTYDYANQLLTVLDPEGKVKGLTFTGKYEYNQYGEKTKKTDALNNSTTYSYNSAGKLLKVTDALIVATIYTLDNAGNMLTMANGKGKVTNSGYGSGSLLRTVTDANSKSTTYKYDLAGNVADVIDRNGNETTMTYDLRNMLKSKSVPTTGDVISYTYDNAGNRATMTDASGVSSYAYDANNKLLNVSKGGTNQIIYTVDKAGNVLTVTDSKGFVTTYTYDMANRMSTVSYNINGSSKTTTYNYDVNGNRKSMAYTGGITESYQYDKNNRLLSLNNTSPFGTVSSYQYTYYDNGLQKDKMDSYGKTTYIYDEDGRIKETDGPGKTTIYNYDNAGNRQTLDETYTSDQFSGYIDQASGNEVKYRIKHSDYVYSDTNALMQLTETMKNSVGTEVLRRITNDQFDNNGNQLSQESDYLQPYNASVGESFNGLNYGNSSKTFDSNLERTENTFDGFNRLTKVDVIKSGNRVSSEFTYNGDDLRVKKVVKKSTNNYAPEETNYLYNGQYVILETNESNAVKVRYLFGVNYIGRVDKSNKTSYFMYNGHGDVVQTIAENGTVENQYDYDIFGNPTLTVEPQYSSAIRYAGEFYDEETGLYYLRSRYYNPMTARFLSEDTVTGNPNDPLSLNLYTYCSNNPIMYVDPTGHRADGELIGRGSTNTDDVRRIQNFLIGYGYLGSDGADGDFGNLTYNAVIAYQRENGFTVDGVVGDETWSNMFPTPPPTPTSPTPTSPTPTSPTPTSPTPSNPTQGGGFGSQIDNLYNGIKRLGKAVYNNIFGGGDNNSGTTPAPTVEPTPTVTPVSPTQRGTGNAELGSLSAKYESNEDPGIISNNSGDPGGKSYGAWQLSSNRGSVDAFLNWLKGVNAVYYQQFIDAKNNDGNKFGSNFDSTWKQIAANDSSGFLQIQHNYIQNVYYDVAANDINNRYGFDISTRASALQNVLWSTAVQHGQYYIGGGAPYIFGKVNLNGTDAEIITAIYNERSRVDEYFPGCDQATKNSLLNRFRNEKADALNMLN